MSDSAVTSVVLVGVGGQGILLASEVLAQAAVFSGFDVKTNEVHGMAQRGGSVVAQIRYGKEVHSPLVPAGEARVLASLEHIEALRYRPLLAQEGMAVVSTQQIIPVTVSSGAATYPDNAAERLRRLFPRLALLDAVGIASGLGEPRAANMVVLGAVAGALELPDESWLEAIRQCVKPKFTALNLEAFAAGREAGQ